MVDCKLSFTWLLLYLAGFQGYFTDVIPQYLIKNGQSGFLLFVRAKFVTENYQKWLFCLGLGRQCKFIQWHSSHILSFCPGYIPGIPRVYPGYIPGISRAYPGALWLGNNLPPLPGCSETTPSKEPSTIPSAPRPRPRPTARCRTPRPRAGVWTGTAVTSRAYCYSARGRRTVWWSWRAVATTGAP